MLATPENEHHEFGIMISALLCASLNLKFYYLGSNLPAEALLDAAKGINCDLIILGTTSSYGNQQNSLDEYLQYCLDHMDKKCKLWLGGSADFNLPQFQKHKKFKFISSLPFLESCLKDL